MHACMAAVGTAGRRWGSRGAPPETPGEEDACPAHGGRTGRAGTSLCRCPGRCPGEDPLLPAEPPSQAARTGKERRPRNPCGLGLQPGRLLLGLSPPGDEEAAAAPQGGRQGGLSGDRRVPGAAGRAVEGPGGPDGALLSISRQHVQPAAQ